MESRYLGNFTKIIILFPEMSIFIVVIFFIGYLELSRNGDSFKHPIGTKKGFLGFCSIFGLVCLNHLDETFRCFFLHSKRTEGDLVNLHKYSPLIKNNILAYINDGKMCCAEKIFSKLKSK